jgi:hypothetical protein
MRHAAGLALGFLIILCIAGFTLAWLFVVGALWLEGKGLEAAVAVLLGSGLTGISWWACFRRT